MNAGFRQWLGGVLAGMLVLLATGCGGEEELRLPDPALAAERYGEGIETELRGNLLQVRVQISEDLLRGGRIWARSGPYFYLFSTATRDLFVENPDLAGVRVIADNPAGEELARATLVRDTMSEYQWRNAIATAALAQQQGTERPGRIEDLIFLGEDFTEFRYGPDAARQ